MGIIHQHLVKESMTGIGIPTRCTSATASTTSIVLPELSGFGDDYFNNQYYVQVLKGNHELLTIDSAPTPSEWAAGATLTGASSLETCTVVTKLTSTTYVVKDRSGTFTDGEVVSDGTNSRDCGTGYPAFTTGAAPEHEVRKITDYVSATGTFTTDAFSSSVETGNECLVLHESLVAIGRDDSNNVFASTNVAADADGSILERLEWIQVALGGTAMQLRVQQSASGTVEETDLIRFAVSLMDMDTGAIASANIDITSITQAMERSRNGSAYSAISDPVVAFSKADGLVYMDYEFKAAQWQVGDMYRMSLSGITCTISSDTAYVPAMIWNNIVVEAEDLTNNTQYLYGVADGGTTSPTKVVDNSILSIVLTKQSGGDTSDFDNSTDSLEAISDKVGAFTGDGGTDYNDSVYANLIALSKYVVDGDGDFATGTQLPSNTSLYDTTKQLRVVAIDGTTPPVANTLSDILHKDGSYTYDNTTDSLEALANAIALIPAATGVGTTQIATTTEDLNQAASTYDLLTGTTQPVILKGFSIKMPTGAAGGALTSISVQTDDATPGVIFNSTTGAVANLTSEAELSWTGIMRINVGTKIQLTIAGGAHGSEYITTITAEYKAIVAGGTLA